VRGPGSGGRKTRKKGKKNEPLGPACMSIFCVQKLRPLRLQNILSLFFCFISKYKFQFHILAHLELVNFCMNHAAKLKAYAYNHDSALLTSLACIRLSCLLLPTTTYVSDQEPAGTWYLSLFNRGWPEDPAISGKKNRSSHSHVRRGEDRS
jgi:hypothetical protein